MARFLGCWLVLGTFSAVWAPIAAAFDGYYDVSLPLGGRNLIDVSPSSSDQGLQLLVLAGGRMLMGGLCEVAAHAFCATRLHPDGSYDTAFGPGGQGQFRKPGGVSAEPRCRRANDGAPSGWPAAVRGEQRRYRSSRGAQVGRQRPRHAGRAQSCRFAGIAARTTKNDAS